LELLLDMVTSPEFWPHLPMVFTSRSHQQTLEEKIMKTAMVALTGCIPGISREEKHGEIISLLRLYLLILIFSWDHSCVAFGESVLYNAWPGH